MSEQTAQLTNNPEVQIETVRLPRLRKLGRNILACTAGAGVFASMTYLGYKIGIDITGPENDTNIANYYAGVALPTIVFGGMGAIGGLWTTVGLAGGENVDLSKPKENGKSKEKPQAATKASKTSSEQPETSEPLESPEHAEKPIEQTADTLAQMANDGTARAEIDAASGNDPELSV